MSNDGYVIHSYQVSTAPLFTRVNFYSCRIGFNCLLLYRLLTSTTPSRNHKLKLFTTWYLGCPTVCTDYNYSVQLVYVAAIPNRKSASEWKSCLAMYRSIYLNIRQDEDRIYLRTHQKLEAYYQICFLSFCHYEENVPCNIFCHHKPLSPAGSSREVDFFRPSFPLCVKHSLVCIVYVMYVVHK